LRTNPGSNENDLIEKIAYKTRTGFIPQMRKTNQDSYLIQKDFSGMKNIWMLGVMDGHGVNGHLASQFVKI